MDHNRNGAEAVAWSALFVLVLRAVSVCVFLFVSINWDILLRNAIQVHACSRATSSGPTVPGSRSDSARNNERESPATDPQRNRELSNPSTPDSPLNQHPVDRVAKTPVSREAQSHVSQHAQDPSNHASVPPPPPPYSLGSSKPSQPKPSVDTIIRLYEDIMASDSQTIEVQQETLCSQQDIIRTQAQVIRKMRQVLEEQDARIEDLEERLGGIRRIVQGTT